MCPLRKKNLTINPWLGASTALLLHLVLFFLPHLCAAAGMRNSLHLLKFNFKLRSGGEACHLVGWLSGPWLTHVKWRWGWWFLHPNSILNSNLILNSGLAWWHWPVASYWLAWHLLCASARRVHCMCTQDQEREGELGYKILLRWYHTPEELNKYFPETSNRWWRCHAEIGSLYHVFWHCKEIKGFWSQVHEEIQEILGDIRGGAGAVLTTYFRNSI